MAYNFTAEQLLELYRSPEKGQGWYVITNQEQANPTLDLSRVAPLKFASVPANGYWKFHLSIDPEQMLQAIPIVHKHFSVYLDRMAMKMGSRDLLTSPRHQSGKQFAIIFDQSEENSLLGQKKIILFLAELACDLQKAGIRPEQRHMLTHETEQVLEMHGNQDDQSNIAMGKYDATIKWHEGEQFSFFNYRAEQPVLMTSETYLMEDSGHDEYWRMVDGSTVKSMEACYKHNPLKAHDPFYALVLHNKGLNASTNKQDFLSALKFKLENQRLSRAVILDLFAEMKNPHGPYAFIHAQRHPSFDRFRLLFKSEVRGQNEQNFWHTKTYQTAVKMLKNAYINAQDELPPARKDEENAFIDYVRGNSVMHCSSTSTRVLFGR